MVLEKKVSKDGMIETTINGKKLDYALSRKLTGTIFEQENGVFSHDRNTEYFEFGDFKASIHFNGTYDESWHIEDLSTAIFARIEKVRGWVDDCKNSGGMVNSSPKGEK